MSSSLASAFPDVSTRDPSIPALSLRHHLFPSNLGPPITQNFKPSPADILEPSIGVSSHLFINENWMQTEKVGAKPTSILGLKAAPRKLYNEREDSN